MSTLNKEKNLSKRIDVALAKKDNKQTFKNKTHLIFTIELEQNYCRFTNWCGHRMDNRSVD